MNEGFSNTVRDLSRLMNNISGVALTFMMALTVCDVFLRSFRHPILGTYEMVALSGAVVIGFTVPYTSWVRGHIYVDFFISKFSGRVRNAFHVVTRCMGILLFFLFGWNLMAMATDLYKSGEVSLTLQLPFYPVAYGVGICCFLQCLVLVCDILKIAGGEYE